MHSPMKNGFNELNEVELLEVGGGDFLIGAAIAVFSLLLAVESGTNNGRAAGKRKFEAEIEEEKYRYPTPVPTPTPALSASYI